MDLLFLGTRGEIEARSIRHRRHSSLLIRRGDARVVIDCGQDWRGRMGRFAPTAIVLTHAHPDHAFGLADGADCPVHATRATWDSLADYPLADARTIAPGAPFDIAGLRFQAFTVVHSVRAPAVGYRVAADGAVFFYVPDVVSIDDRTGALAGADLFVGDGATVTRSMVRRVRKDALVGHTPVRTQLGWCREEGVPRALFTHCGTQIVAGDEPAMAAKVRALGDERGVAADLAHDGLHLSLPFAGKAG
jgi:phosphoribosyl 1,2-cyclic phosphodiesterase